jgi:prevent-host-death family protein
LPYEDLNVPVVHAPIGRLKARLSEFLSRVRAGEEVVITDRGTPVAKLVPLSGEAAREGRRAELARAGLVREPGRPLDRSFLEAPRPADPDGRSLEAVLEERAEGW